MVNTSRDFSAEGCSNGFDTVIEGKYYCHVHAPKWADTKQPLREELGEKEILEWAEMEFNHWYGGLAIEWRDAHRKGDKETLVEIDEVIPGDVELAKKVFFIGFKRGLKLGIRENEGVKEMLEGMRELRENPS